MRTRGGAMLLEFDLGGGEDPARGGDEEEA